jgi:hypothetical protein
MNYEMKSYKWITIQDPIKLFDYCLEIHDFGDICSLYYEDSSGDFCLESPYDL